jgi:PilZ domain
MGKRIEPRKEVSVPVRIFGTDKTGAVFSQKASTINISHSGVELVGVEAALAVNEIVGLTYGPNKVHFRVKWVGKSGSPKAGHVGLLNVSPGKPLWDFPLSPSAPDPYQPGTNERRQHPRYRCQTSIEIHVHNGPSFWGTLADLSLGGCYAEMPIPLESNTKLRISIWLGQEKIKAEAQVVHRTPGFGVGIRFTQLAPADADLIGRYLNALAPLARKSGIAAALRAGR